MNERQGPSFGARLPALPHFFKGYLYFLKLPSARSERFREEGSCNREEHVLLILCLCACVCACTPQGVQSPSRGT